MSRKLNSAEVHWRGGYVCFVENSGPPSVVHDSLGEATWEADRLARSTGLAVFVLQIISKHELQLSPVLRTELKL